MSEIRYIHVSDSIGVSEKVNGKSKEKINKRPEYEFKAGDSYFRDRKKYVDRVMIIDRKHDKYFEQVVDKQTGKIIHGPIYGKLSEHQGHGSAKSKR